MSSLAMVGTPLRVSGRVAGPTARRAMVVRASAQADRRKVLGGLVAGVALLPAAAVVAAERIEGRTQQENPMGRSSPQQDNPMGRSQLESRTSINDSKARVQDSRRALKDVMNVLEKGNWTESQDRLRRQTGDLRNDLDNLARNASNRNAAERQTKDFFAQVDQLDNAIRNQNRDKARAAYDRAINSLDRVMDVA